MSGFPDITGKSSAEIMAMIDEEIDKSLGCYILDENKRPKKVPFSESIQWRTRVGVEASRVARTHINDDLYVSTVFLGQGRFSTFLFPDRKPLLFETMVFAEGKFKNMDSHTTGVYETWEEAAKGHEETVAKLRAEIRK